MSESRFDEVGNFGGIGTLLQEHLVKEFTILDGATDRTTHDSSGINREKKEK